jgi:Flp pilus assembly protein TadD
MSAAPAAPPRGPRTAALALLVGALAVAPYLPAGTGAFVNLDDPAYVLRNDHVRGGLSLANARWAFTAFYAANWHPLTWLSHQLDVTLFGLDPRGHHLDSVLLHGAAAALLFLALARLTGRRWPSAAVAALFGVHPLHVESVAWVAERKDVLAGLFFMLTLLAYERAARRGRVLRSVALPALFALGLMAKPMLVTLPCVLLLLDFWPLGRLGPPRGAAPVPADRWRDLVVEKLPLLALAAAAGVVTVLAQGARGAVQSVDLVPLGQRLGNALVSYAAYLGTTLWPVRLAAYYPHPGGTIGAPALLGAGLLLAALTGAAVAGRRTRPALAAGWLWFAGMLVPVIGLVQVGAQARADRYTYLPLIGIFVAVAWVAAALPALRRRPALLGALAGAAILACGARSVVQTGYWRDSETLWRRTLAVTDDNWLAHNNLGLVLKDSGRAAEAIEHFRAVLRIAPDLAGTSWNHLGMALAAAGRTDEAEAAFRESIRARPQFAEARCNLGLLLLPRRPAEAVAALGEALALRPDLFEARYALAQALVAAGRPAEALPHFREAARLRPGDPAILVSHAAALLRLGRPAEALPLLDEAIRLQPGSFEAAANRRLALEALKAVRPGSFGGP